MDGTEIGGGLRNDGSRDCVNRPKAALCQIVNVSQTSGKWGSRTFHSRGKEMKDMRRGEGNSNMGFLLFALCHCYVEITCYKRSCSVRSLL